MEGPANGESKFFTKKVNFVASLEVEGPQSDPFSDCESNELTFDLDPDLYCGVSSDSNSESETRGFDLTLSRGCTASKTFLKQRGQTRTVEVTSARSPSKRKGHKKGQSKLQKSKPRQFLPNPFYHTNDCAAILSDPGLAPDPEGNRNGLRAL